MVAKSLSKDRLKTVLQSFFESQSTFNQIKSSSKVTHLTRFRSTVHNYHLLLRKSLKIIYLRNASSSFTIFPAEKQTVLTPHPPSLSLESKKELFKINAFYGYQPGLKKAKFPNFRFRSVQIKPFKSFL